MSDWKTGTPRELIADLRPGGWVQGHSGLFHQYLRLHKTDLISDLGRMKPEATLIWKINGDAAQTGRHAKDRRNIIVWLGK